MEGSTTLYRQFRETARRLDLPVALAAKRDGTWQTSSHAELVERVRHLSCGLHDLGVTAGDRVAIVSESRPEWTMVDLATLGCAAALVPVYPTLTADQVQHILADSGARVCVVSDQTQLDKVLGILASLPDLQRIVVIDRAEAPQDVPVTTLAEVERRGEELERESPELSDRLAAEGSIEDLATLIYTSGTTGKQKGVILTNRNFVSNIDASFVETNFFSSSDSALSYLPLSHIFERTFLYGCLKVGVPVHFATSFDTVAAELREVRPTVVTSVPRFFEKMYERICNSGTKLRGLRAKLFQRALECGDRRARLAHAGERVGPLTELEYRLLADRAIYEKWRDACGGRMRFFISGGAPLSKDIAYAFLGAGLKIYEGYGLTETSPVIAVNTPSAHRIGTVGRPLSNLEIRIDTDGEILVRGPSIMKGYYNLEDATAQAFTEDGFFRTGDVGELDSDGYLRITDRKKDLLKTSGGKYVAPQPIENRLKASNLIDQAVLIGERRKYCSALIVPNFKELRAVCESQGITYGSDEELSTDPKAVAIVKEAVDSLTSDLARFEQIKRIALLPRELTIEAGEVTPTLKVKRKVVEERYSELIEGLYSDTGEGASVHG